MPPHRQAITVMAKQTTMLKFKWIYTIAFFACSTVANGQNINLIIQVNGRLETASFSNMYVTLDTIINHAKYYVEYVPGDLTLPQSLTDILKRDSSKVIMLHFTFNTHKKNDHQTAHFYRSLPQAQLKQPYLILNIYDFRDRKYRRYYQQNKEQEFVSELNYPNSGILIRNQ